MQSVLVVDDEPVMRDSAKTFLERFGNMDVRTAVSAKEALSILADSTFDALVVDYSLPEISGIEMLKILRTKGDTTPVIIFTGVGREHAAIEALNNGADFFLKKGESPSSEFRELVHMINRAAERRVVGRSLGTSQKLLEETIRFFPDAAYAIDREARVVAWNQGMTDLTGVEAKEIIGKDGGAHAIPFFGKAHPMLTELVFEKDDAINRRKYTITSREDGAICAWTVTQAEGGDERVIWMKAAALHDAKGAFIAAVGAVRDITGEIGPELLRQQQGETTGPEPAIGTAPSQGQVLGRLMGRARSSHREGLRLSYREAKYAEAIVHFDKAIEIDPAHAAAWHDRGVCLRELGRDAEALKSFVRAVELAPDDEEFLFSSAEMLKRIGILRGKKSHIEGAVAIFERIVEINPNHAEAWNSLGICMKELGKDHTAAQYFSRAQGIIRQNKAKKKVRNFDQLV
ncbi:MAG TPA: response regulator [Methanoregula sp.]|nr:response regulator [Methanoregula sp.]